MKLEKKFSRWLVSALLVLMGTVFTQSVQAKCLTPPGDIDGSTKTNVNDVQCEILMTLWVLGGKVAPLPICLKAEVVDADINCDGALNVSDVQLVIQLALGAQLSPVIDADGDGCADLCDFDTDGDGEPNLTDCSPFDPSIYPGAPEVCNGHDDDCDGARDEEVGTNAVKCSNDDVCDGVEICAGLPGSPGLVISELMINPAGPDAADDGFLEWIEIFNAGPTTVDLRNYVIKDNSGQFHQITAPNPVLAEAGGFAILARNGDYLANGGVYVDYVYSGFTMANTVDAVVLVNPVGVEVDRVEYNTALGWVIPSGASISVTDPSANNNASANWAASTAPWRPETPANPPDPAIPASDFGTPGGPGVPPTLLCQDNPALVCSDDDACNGIETCHPITGCQNGAAPNCDDGLACTADSCTPGPDDTHTCNNILTANSCEIGGACIAAGTENPQNQCEVCDPTTNSTDWSPKPNGSVCNEDSNGCTVGDSCQDGTCTIGTTETCDDGLACTADSCTTTGPDSFTCNNVLGAGACLIGAACFADGAENPGNQCQICDAGTNPTAWTNKSNGAACNADDTGCTVDDACSDGTCTAGAAPNCADNLTCTADSCVSTGVNSFTCDHELIAGNCLIGGVCFGDGTENPGNQCQLCDVATATGAWTDKSNGTACNADDTGCTVDDVCSDGTCTAGAAPNCADNLTCTADSCVSTGDNSFTCDHELIDGNCLIGGVCFGDGAENPDNQCQLCDVATATDAWTDKANGTTCTDGSGCTVDDACADGTCIAGAAPDCDDNLTCTDDSCVSTGDDSFTCDHDLVAGNCLIGGVCFGDGAENPDNQCQLCDVATATGAWTDKANGTACNADDTGCTVDDVCSDGTCTAGAAPDCDDNLTCTADSCSSTGDNSFTCEHELIAGNCLIGGVCFGDGTENPDNECELCDSAVIGTSWTDKSDGTACSADGSGCTVNDACFLGTCNAGAAPDCDDNLTCTDDSCVSTGDNSFTCDHDLVAGNCLIGGVCFGGGTENPDNQCQLCDVATATGAWTDKANGTACNADDTGCTVDDVCSDGTCTAGAAPDCDDNLTCTADSCSSTGDNSFTCEHELIAGNCLIGGVCFGDGAENPDNQCQLCDEATATDAWTDKANGTTCTDGSGCTVDDVCADGTCMAGAAPDCDDNLTCTDDSCVSTGDDSFTCEHELIDGNCLIGGVCFGDGTENPDNQCQLCDVATATGAWTDKANGTACNADDTGCTVDDVCSDGTCTAGAAPDCDDNLTCTADSCAPTGANSFVCVNDLLDGNCNIGGVCFADGAENPNNQCQICDVATSETGWTNKSEGTVCNDGINCTENDACSAGGVCGGTAIDCSSLSDQCNLGTCEEATGTCFAQPINQGMACDDAFACTVGDRCLSGTCTGVNNSSLCDDANGCTTNVCQPTNGAADAEGCVYLPNSLPCSDGDACTLNDTCAGGSCQPGPVLNCDDLNECTADECNAGNCTHTPQAGTCDNADLCTIGVCSLTGLCLITPVVCVDGNVCTADTCEPAQGCLYPNLTNGTGCDDDEPCTLDTVCTDGACGGGIPNACDDGNPCTADSCIPGTGCQNLVDDTLICDDGDLCTTNVCIAGTCTITDSVDCTDTNPCTIDVCNPLTGLCDVFEPDGTLCEDGDQCTGPDICINGNCSITPIDECFTPTVNVLCVMYGPAGTIFDCEILLAKSEAGAFPLEDAATGLQVLLEYDEAQVTLQGFVDEICFGPGLCFEYVVGAPGFPNAVETGHTLATQPEEVVDWDGGGQFLLADTSSTSNLLTDAYLTAGVGTDVNNDPLIMRARFVFDVDIAVDAPVFLFAPDIAASDENATPLDYEVYNRIIVTSPYTVPCANPGGPCDDGDPCTLGDICVGGVCVSGDSIDGAPCDDGDQCTFQDACINGSCTTSPLPECSDGTQLACAITGSAGSSFACSLNVASASAADLPATGLQLDIVYPNSVVLTGFYDGELCAPACQPWSIPNPFPMLQSGHAVFLSPPDPAMWTTGGEFWLLHFSDPTTPISDAVFDGGGVLQGDPIVVQAFFDLAVDIPSSSPALVTVSDVKPVDQNAGLLNFSFQNLLMTTSSP